MEFTGKLTRWDDAQGCGFITPEQGGDDLPMPLSALQPGMVRPSVGDTVCFRIEADAQGHKRAARVHWPAAAPPVKRVVPERVARRRSGRRPRYSRIVFVVLLVLLGAGIYGFTRVGARTAAPAPAPAAGTTP